MVLALLTCWKLLTLLSLVSFNMPILFFSSSVPRPWTTLGHLQRYSRAATGLPKYTPITLLHCEANASCVHPHLSNQNPHFQDEYCSISALQCLPRPPMTSHAVWEIQLENGYFTFCACPKSSVHLSGDSHRHSSISLRRYCFVQILLCVVACRSHRLKRKNRVV